MPVVRVSGVVDEKVKEPFQKAMAGECSELQAAVLQVGGVRLGAQDEKAGTSKWWFPRFSFVPLFGEMIQFRPRLFKWVV